MQILQKSWTFFNKTILGVLIILMPLLSRAQAPAETESVMLSHGKIYVVVLVISTIFAGIILFLIYIERKVNKLEKRSSNK